jgi:hypothetical protein
LRADGRQQADTGGTLLSWRTSRPGREVFVEQRWWWCVRHHTVEPDGGPCANQDRLGPYATVEEASRALQQVQERNARHDAEDKAWDDA